MNKRQIGSEQEYIAEQYLIKNGYIILERNFNTRTGEIDMIAKDREYLVFIEVKYRSSTAYGYPEEAITSTKKQKIIKTARYYMQLKGISQDVPCRFDVIVILKEDIHLIKDAFQVI